MRDIRGDLLERASLVEQEISGTVSHFAKQIEPLRLECDARVAELKAQLTLLRMLIETEQKRMAEQPAPPLSPVPEVSDTIGSDLKKIGDRIRQLHDEDAGAASQRGQALRD